MNLFRDIERRIDERLRKLFGSESAPGQGRELVELQRMILDRIDERVQQLPRARRVFPYNDVAVRIPAPDAEKRAAYETVFVADDALREEIADHLRREEVEFPRDLTVVVTLIETTELSEPSLICRNREAADQPARKAAPESLPVVRFTPVSGGAPTQITRSRIHVGRNSEVLDDRRRLVRRNDLVVEHDTVSRAHAHLEYTAGEYRLFDDGSSYGTSVIHQGRLVEVPRAGGRGMRVDSGDEIYFGQVRVRFELLSPLTSAS
jgi:hypothetical protein